VQKSFVVVWSVDKLLLAKRFRPPARRGHPPVLPAIPSRLLIPRAFSLPRLFQVESTHATPYTEDADDGQQASRAGDGTAGAAAAGGNGGGGEDGSSAKQPQQQRRRRSTGTEVGRKATLPHRGVGYPMAAVAAVLRQLHMRVLSVEEMKMLDQVRILGARMGPRVLTRVFWTCTRGLRWHFGGRASGSVA